MIISMKLKELKSELSDQMIKEASLPQIKQKYPELGNEEFQGITSLPVLKKYVNTSIRELNTNTLSKRSQADNDLFGRSLRIALNAAVYAFLIGYCWFYWPVPAKQHALLFSVGVEDPKEDVDIGHFP